MKLRRALWLCAGLSSAACGDDSSKVPADPGPDVLLDGGSVSPEAGVDGAQPGRYARVVSVAPSYLVVGDSYNYTPKTNTTARTVALTSAPEGMTVRNGAVRWSPSDVQAGDYHVTLRTTGAGSAAAEQSLNITVVRSTLRADGVVTEEGGSVHASGPGARRVLGMGASVPARSVSSSTRISVSELEKAPAMPNSQGQGTAAQFGPHGQVFSTAAQLSLALPQGATYAAQRMGVYVYRPAGSWQRVPMMAVDLDNGVAIAKALHFSIYAAIQSSIDLDVTLARATGSSCAGALVGRATVSSPLSELELASVNNLSVELSALVASGDVSVQDVLALLSFRGSLRAVQVLDLVERHGDTEVLRDRKLAVTTLFVPGDGSATITHTDALGNVLATKHYPSPALELADIGARLRGAATAGLFAGETGAELGLAARVFLAYFPGDSSLDPVSVDDLGQPAAELAPSFAELADSSVADVDCDGLLAPFDTTDDSVVAAIDASPSSIASVFTGDSVTLSARLLRGAPGAIGTWSLLDGDGAALSAVSGAPDARSFTATASGRYLVSFRAPGSGAQLEHIFAVDVAERVVDSAPPSCQPSKELDIGRVGEAVALSGVVADADSPLSALTIEWGLVDASAAAPVLTPASTLLVRGDKALFSPLDAGNFVVGCRAFDGHSYGSIGTVDLSVVGRDQNRGPVDVVLSPMRTSIAANGALTLHAFAKDPDGDALTFQWDVTGAGTVDDPLSADDRSSLHLTGEASGKIEVQLKVSDGKAPAVLLQAEVLVGDVPVGVDADGDGWVAGAGTRADCDDNDASIYPGAVDKCGDARDGDCDGVIELDDCDHDRYGASSDCDDADPRRHPGARELCDGLDNDCNQAVDEGFSVGKTCSTGTGQCAARGLLECSADGLTQLCAAMMATAPTAETCDGIDNDCDGEIDDGVCLVDAGTPDAGSIDAGVLFDASVATCLSQGAELCTDGKDNDCDGDIDSKDKDCQVVTADSCQNPGSIAQDKPFGGSFDNATEDSVSQCASSVGDLVYPFTLAQASNVSVLLNSGAPAV